MKKTFAFLILISLLFVNCKSTIYESSFLIDYVSNDTSVIIKINDLQAFKSGIKNNTFLKETARTLPYKDLQTYLEQLNHLNTYNELLICFNEVGAGSFEYTIITKAVESLFKLDAVSNKKIETFTYENIPIQKIIIENTTSYTTRLNNIIINSSSQLIIENSIRRFKNEKIDTEASLLKAYETCDNENPASIIINNTNAYSIFKHIFPNNTPENIKNSTDWLAVDIKLEQNEITLDGIALSNKSENKILPLFNDIIPEINTIAKIAPVSADGFISYSYSDWGLLKQNLSVYNKKTGTTASDFALFDASNEIGIIYNGIEKCIALHYTNIEAAKIELENERSVADEYRGISIYKYPDFKVLVNTFSPLVSNSAANFYTILDDFLIFSDNIGNLHHIISNYQSKSTLSNTNSYLEAMSGLNDAASILIVSNNSEFKESISNLTKDSYKKDIEKLEFKGYPHFILQFVSDNGFSHFNAAIKEIKKQGRSGTVSQLLSTTLDADVATAPQFVINHRTKQKEIVVQDIENHLYLISNKGKILWKKKLNEQIQGGIKQVDLYKNGRLQLAFVTQSEFQIIDRNGEEVPPFPLKFDKNITQPLAVFDYDKNKEYRFLLSFGKELKMYDNSGTKVSGFKFSKASEQILTTPKHFREGKKDYITITDESGKLYILNRRGQTRIKVKEKIDFSGNDIFMYKGKFSTTDSKGNLLQVDSDGKIKKQQLGLLDNHKIDATAKTLVSISDNILSIKNKKVELDFGFYSKPTIFYINDKIYVSITDTQANKVYLFDSNAVSISGFPVYGISAIDLTDIDNDNKLELVVQGEKKSVIVYRLN